MVGALPASYTAVAKTVPNLRAADLRRLLNLAGYRGQEPEFLEASVCMLLWLTDCMSAWRFMAPAYQDLVLSELLLEIMEYGARLHEATRESSEHQQIPVALLAVSDRVYVTMSGKDGFLDLTAGKWIQGLPQFPLTTMTYNLAGIFQCYRQRLNNGKMPGQ